MKSNPPGRRSWFLEAIEILALWNLAIAQPVFNVLSRGSEFFIVRRASGLEIVVFVVLVAIVFPLSLWIIEQLLSIFGQNVKQFFHEFLIWLLISLFFIAFLRNMDFLPDIAKLSLSLIVAGLIILLRKNYPALKSFFVFLFPAIIAVPAMFLATPAIWKIVSAETPTIPGHKTDATAPVVILVLDEFPLSILLNKEGRIDCSRYPNFCKFAETATWFKNASSVSDRTQEVVTALLTGRYPVKESVPTVFDHPENLFTLLNQTYEMNIQEALTSLNPVNVGAEIQQFSFVENEKGMISDASAVFLQSVLPPSFAEKFPSVQQTWSNFWESGGSKKSKRDKVLGRGENWNLFISELHDGDRPELFFKHVILPHGPWQYFPSGVEYNFARFAQPTTEDRGDNWSDEVTANRALQRHMLQTGFVDHQIGKLIKRLKDIGLFDSAVIVIMGDHGISFSYGDQRRDLTDLNRADILWIPLFIKQPNQTQGRISDFPVETIDILPSIASSLKITIPWKVDGQSAVDENYHPRAERRAYQWFEKKGLLKSFTNFGISRNSLSIQSLFSTDRPFDDSFFLEQTKCSADELQPAEYTLDKPELFEDVNPELGFVPAFITGKLQARSEKAGGTLVAASVNGSLRGCARTFPVDKENHGFAILVPEKSFRSGKNSIQISVVRSKIQ